MMKMTYSEFLLRRLHSLTGLVPLTVFIFFHLFANAYSSKGEVAFNGIVTQLRGLPLLHAIEWSLLFGPFLFHMIYGLWIIFTGQPNPLRQPFARNWAYFLQRATALVVFVFVIYHVVSLNILDPATNRQTGKTDFYNYLRVYFQQPVVYWWYVLGIACTVYHTMNGICTFCMTWGITIGRRSQRLTAYAVTAVGAVLLLVGISALNGFVHAPENVLKPERSKEHAIQRPAAGNAAPQEMVRVAPDGSGHRS